MSTKLSIENLGALPGEIARPKYDRGALKGGILHIGVGNFHRAHQAVYLDDLFGSGVDHDWAIIGAGGRDADRVVRENLGQQDWLTTVVEREAAGSKARVIAPHVDFIEPGDV